MDNGGQQPELLSQSLHGCIELGVLCALYARGGGGGGGRTAPTSKQKIVVVVLD